MRPLVHSLVLAALIIPAAACDRSEAAGSGGAGETKTEEAADADAAQEAPNSLTRQEASEGFELLFDGQALDGWRGYGRDDLPGGWSAEDGAIAYTPEVEGGDIITRDTFTDFDLRLEWRISPGGNSGIMYGVVEGPEYSYYSGPEMQVLDNAGHPDGGDALTSAGADYGLYAPSADVTRPVGEWNEVRIVRRGNHVEHWLNGMKIVEYELGDDEWKSLVAASKFAEWPDYGMHHEGHIALQDHGARVWYRNLRIRRLP